MKHKSTRFEPTLNAFFVQIQLAQSEAALDESRSLNEATQGALVELERIQQETVQQLDQKDKDLDECLDKVPSYSSPG